jgi:phosphoribosylformylglycinamidine cyclo-ligase
VNGDVLMALPSVGTYEWILTRAQIICRCRFYCGCFARIGRAVGLTLLTPHLNYTQPILHLLQEKIQLKGMAHITGGGVLENIPRILPADCAVEINKAACPVLPIFTVLRQLGHLDDAEMYRTFNMGIGMVIIVAPETVSKMRAAFTAFPDFPLYEIGRVVSGKQQVRLY